MAQGFSGGFFLPAQRSVHCKGGFFASATRAPGPVASTGPANATNQQQQPPQFPVLFTLPQTRAPPIGNNNVEEATTSKSRHRVRRVYDPEEGDEDTGHDDIVFDRIEHEEPEKRLHPSTAQVQRSASTSRFVRGRQHTPRDQKMKESVPVRTSHSTGTSRKPRSTTNSSQPQTAKPSNGEGDINNKFELAMKELNEIKGEFELKQQRQSSAPALVIAHSTAAAASASLVQSMKSVLKNKSPQTPLQIQPSETTEDPSQPHPPAPSRDLQSPRQRLQVAEMVMRKLYKKNLQTEQELATAKAANEQLLQQLTQLQAEKTSSTARVEEPEASSVQPPPTTATTGSCCARCSLTQSVGFVLANPPSMETISRIDQQQLDYLRHLAAEQDRTITSLKIRIEELSTQLTTAKQQQQQNQSTGAKHTAKTKSSTPRQVANKLQSKLQDARLESERQKSNYLQLKRDFQHLLALKTKTLYENPQQLNASARGLVELMEKQLRKLEKEHSVDLAGYNSKLYEIEQQSCESYAQKRMMEEEMERVARDVQQRDAIDVEIEQCMATVFERLHSVESENVHLKKALS